MMSNLLIYEHAKPYSGQRLNPKNDFLFRKLFAEEEGKPLLISLLNAVLRREGAQQIKDITILENTTLAPELIGDKEISLDLRCQTDSNELVDVEMQIRRFKAMGVRSLYYMSRLLAASIKSGQSYEKLKRTIGINILDHTYFPFEKFHSIFQLYEDELRDLMLTDILELHFLECPKFCKTPFNIHDPLHRWMRFLDQQTSPEQLKELMEMDENIRMAESRLDYFALDDSTRYLYDMREKAMLDRDKDERPTSAGR